MHHIREILRQKLALKRSHRQIAASTGVSPSTVSSTVAAARALGLDLAAVEKLSDAELEAQLYAKQAPTCMRPEPDCAALDLELRRPGVTLALLHLEYLTAHPDGFRYTVFCDRYRAWSKRRSPVMRQVHVAGDKLAVLGASNFTFAEATRSQSVPDFLGSVTRALNAIGGVPRAIVPDQLKSAVIKACRYDPGVQRTTAELARHYDTTILPARPKSPRDKAKVEVGVQVAERWLLARIRNETFTSLAALNARLTVLTAELNQRVMRTYKASRRDLFERLDKPALMPLPAEPFAVSTWKQVRLNIDYHVAFEDHLYSAPHALRHEEIELWLRATTTTVEIFHGRERVAAHARSYVRGGFTTTTEHMPSSHRAHAEWTPSRILGWADQVGPSVRALCEVILQERVIPNGDTARASASFGSRRSTATRASTLRVAALSTQARAATSRCRPSSSTGSTRSRCPNPKRPPRPGSRTRTFAVPITTTDPIDTISMNERNNNVERTHDRKTPRAPPTRACEYMARARQVRRHLGRLIR